MKISIIGAGYVGLVTGTCFSELGHEVVVVDINEEKVKAINSKKCPIYEPGLEEMLVRNVDSKRLRATTDIKDVVMNTDVTYIAVGTPMKEDRSIDLRYIEKASEDIGNVLKEKAGYHLVVVKSTVVPGTTENIVGATISKISGKKLGTEFGIAMNPEFLREGSAVEDFMKPDRIVIGANDEKARSILEEIYKKIDAPKLYVNIKTAEMIKYASNTFLATKISFINEIGNICKLLGINVFDVVKGMTLDHRISPYFLRAGIGFGGSCFPKDTNAIIALAKKLGYVPRLLDAVVEINETQPLRAVELLKKHISLKGKNIGVLGLAFKPNTDDVRETRAYPIIRALNEEGAVVYAYDPKAMDAFKKAYPDVKVIFCKSAEEVLKNAEAIIIATEWDEFEKLSYRNKIVVDGRYVKAAKETAKIYEGVCW